MRNYEKCVAVAMIAYFVGMATMTVGTVLPPTDKPVQWTLPMLVLAMTGAPALAAYMAGKKDGRDG